MLELSIVLGVLCLVLYVNWHITDRKNDRLINENGVMKGRLQEMENKPEDADGLKPLSVEGVEEAIRYLGYVPVRSEKWVCFMVDGDKNYIDTNRFPIVTVARPFAIERNKWDLELLRKAADKMSEDLIMVKAAIVDDDSEKEPDLRIFIAALDANTASFRENLRNYLQIIDDGETILNNRYKELEKERDEAAGALSSTRLLPGFQAEKKVVS